MSAVPNPSHTRATVEAYLEIDANSDVKHEFINGEIVMFAGASHKHNRIKGNLERIVSSRLPKGCYNLSSDQRLYAPTIRNYTYPDYVVVCGEAQFTQDKFDTLTNPVLIAEVLSSDSTADYDRGAKTDGYLQIPTLQHLLLVSQDQPVVTVYHRQPDNKWLREDLIGLGNELNLTALRCTMGFDELFDGVSF